MKRVDSSSELSQRLPPSASLDTVRSNSYASAPTRSARDSRRAINLPSDGRSAATSEIAIAQGAARHAAPWRSITSSTPGFSRPIACIIPPGTSTMRGRPAPPRAASETPRVTKSPTSRRSTSSAASAPKPSTPLAVTTGRSNCRGRWLLRLNRASTLLGLVRSTVTSPSSFRPRVPARRQRVLHGRVARSRLHY